MKILTLPVLPRGGDAASARTAPVDFRPYNGSRKGLPLRGRVIVGTHDAAREAIGRGADCRRKRPREPGADESSRSAALLDRGSNRDLKETDFVARKKRSQGIPPPRTAAKKRGRAGHAREKPRRPVAMGRRGESGVSTCQ